MEVGFKKAERKMCFEETELRLGLPGNRGGTGTEGEAARKRGFSETETDSETTAVDLMLNLSSKESAGGKDLDKAKKLIKEKMLLPAEPENPTAKAQVVGWPPVRSFRKNILASQKTNTEENEKASGNATFVKVSVDGAPYLRKVNLKMYKSYQELSDALGKMFSSFTIGNCGNHGMKDFMNESKLRDLLNNSDYAPSYEDKDGDWMLVGDVPWEMFVESCKRLRIMKATEAIGLAPRAMEKCKNRR